jgi:hypothetical protein
MINAITEQVHVSVPLKGNGELNCGDNLDSQSRACGHSLVNAGYGIVISQSEEGDSLAVCELEQVGWVHKPIGMA